MFKAPRRGKLRVAEYLKHVRAALDVRQDVGFHYEMVDVGPLLKARYCFAIQFDVDMNS